MKTVDLNLFSRFVEARLGLCFPPERWPDLEKGLQSAAVELGFDDPEGCADWFLNSEVRREQIELLATHLTVGETYFFRDMPVFVALENHVLPALIAQKRRTSRRIRLWSAGCCTGEEPYSLAILLRQLLPDLADWNVTILGTDVNPRFLQKAFLGIYTPWSFRGMEKNLQERCFLRAEGGRFKVRPEVASMVTFAPLNLATDAYPSILTNTNAIDVLLCRNVLMYFSKEQAAKVTAQLLDCLVEEGWFFAGPTEIPHPTSPRLTPRNLAGTLAYRKTKASFADRKQPAKACAPMGKAQSDDRIKERPASGADAATRARELADAGVLGEALAACDEAIAANKLSPAHQYLRGMILQEKGDKAQAMAAFQRALFLDPGFVLAHVAMFTLLLQTGRTRDAERSLRNARALLHTYAPEMQIPDSGGLTAQRLLEVLDEFPLAPQ